MEDLTADEGDTEAGPSLSQDDEGDNDEAYGPSAAPEDGNPDEDDEGRFFGGGITARESAMLDFVEDSAANHAVSAASEKIDIAWLRKTALAFEKRISRNAEQRSKYESDPAKFIESEADLDNAVFELSILAEHPDLYPEFARLGTAASLVGLLAHENTDIAIAAVQIIGELMDEDVQATDEQWAALVDAMLEADLVALLVANLERLDEIGGDDTDRNGVYNALLVVESLCSRASTALAVGADQSLLQWLLKRIQNTEKPVSQNKQYAAEALAILARAGRENRERLVLLDAMNIFLELAAAYRRRDPEKGGEEEEYMANLFETMRDMLNVPMGKAAFVAAEGVELCLIMVKEGKMSKLPALLLLDHAVGAVSAVGGVDVCIKLVETGGLKTLFTMFMRTSNEEVVETLLNIFEVMLRLLPADSAERIRTLAKFVEKDYEKTEKLFVWRTEYAAKVAAVEEQTRQDEESMTEEEKQENVAVAFLQRMDAGLYPLYMIDIILTWLVAEDDGARSKIQSLLAGRNATFAELKANLEERLRETDSDIDDGKEKRDMLSTLIEFLQ